MYEVKLDEDSKLVAQVWQPANRAAAKFALIAIRQNDRGGGVTEVARMNATPDSWIKQSDSQIGLTFLQSASINESVEAGTYRIEISTPENAGKFLLRIGDSEAEEGYLESLSSVRTTQEFFGHGLFSMLRSSLVYQPLLFFLLMFVVYKSWQYRKVVKIKAHVSN